MKNLKKISNYSIAGLLAIGVLVLSFFAYQTKIQADTILPGYATAHVGLDVTVPDARAVPFTVKFTPTDGSKTYYFKSRNFSFEVPGLNTVEWYIRKIPQGEYRVTVHSSGNQLMGSPIDVSLITDKVNETTDFVLNLGEPPIAEESTYQDAPLENTEENQLEEEQWNGDTEANAPFEEEQIYDSPVPVATATTQSGSIPMPGSAEYEIF